jgi:hypothetical protein
MADLVITASQILPGTEAEGARFAQGLAGAAITAGKVLYKDSAAGTYKLADNNDTSSALAVAVGVALHAAEIGQPIRMQTDGPMTIGAGAAPAAGTIYVLSATAGGIAPSADLATGNRATILGVGMASNRVMLRIHVSGQTKP